MKAMVFAAGLGTRLKPYTNTMPKALVPIQGEPLLGHVLSKLGKAGFDQVVVNVHHFANQIEEYLANHSQGVNYTISDERSELLETGGGIKHAETLLNGSGAFLVHNVDILSNINLAEFYYKHSQDSVATLLVSERHTERYLLFDKDMRLVGWTNVKTGEVRTPYATLEVEQCRKLAFSGVHVISDSIFELMDNWNGKFSIIDFYLSVCKDVVIKGVVMDNVEMVDVGKLDSLKVAERFVDLYYND